MTSDYSAVKHVGRGLLHSFYPGKIPFFNQAVTEIDIHLKVEKYQYNFTVFFYKWTERTMYNKITFYSPD